MASGTLLRPRARAGCQVGRRSDSERVGVRLAEPGEGGARGVAQEPWPAPAPLAWTGPSCSSFTKRWGSFPTKCGRQTQPPGSAWTLPRGASRPAPNVPLLTIPVHLLTWGDSCGRRVHVPRGAMRPRSLYDTTMVPMCPTAVGYLSDL